MLRLTQRDTLPNSATTFKRKIKKWQTIVQTQIASAKTALAAITAHAPHVTVEPTANAPQSKTADASAARAKLMKRAIALTMVVAALGSHALAQEQTSGIQQSGTQQQGSGQALCPL